MKFSSKTVRGRVLTGVLCTLYIATSFITTSTANSATAIPEIRPGILQGYLDREEYPDSLKLLPPPPTPGSAAQARDDAASQRAMKQKDTARYAMATRDNNLLFPQAADTFACALGIQITETGTPTLYLLLRRSLTDAGLATYAAKNHYQRRRPFLVNGAGNCASEAEQVPLAKDGSYPSGHTAIGWAWALILTELAPDRADQILARGRAFGDNRMICNVHWASDVAEGRVVGAAAVATLHTNADFLADLESASSEIKAAQTAGNTPNGDCDAEAAALTRQPDG